MKKYDLLRSGKRIIRVLDVQSDRVLVIDCIKRTMPVWVESVVLESYVKCTLDDLVEVTGVTHADVDTFNAEQRKIMYERYTMITPILSFVADDKMRRQLIQSAAVEYDVSKQTVRNYLCLYLAYLDASVLAPKARRDDRELTHDEKNIR